jgi:hypothetical protein
MTLFDRKGIVAMWKATLLAASVTVLGCDGAPSKIENTGLIGRWDDCRSDQVFIRFNSDGTFRWMTLTDQLDGRYRVLDGNAIEFTLTHRRGKVASEFKYRLHGHVLDIRLGNEWVRFQRSDGSFHLF